MCGFKTGMVADVRVLGSKLLKLSAVTTYYDPKSHSHGATIRSAHLASAVSSNNSLWSIVSAGKHLSNTNLSDLSIVGTRDIFVYQQRHQII